MKIQKENNYIGLDDKREDYSSRGVFKSMSIMWKYLVDH